MHDRGLCDEGLPGAAQVRIPVPGDSAWGVEVAYLPVSGALCHAAFFEETFPSLPSSREGCLLTLAESDIESLTNRFSLTNHVDHTGGLR